MEFKGYDLRSARIDKGAARRLAIETTQNIANVKFGVFADDPDVPAVTRLLSGRSMSIAQVAKELTWDSARAAKALARGGESGVLSFSKEGDTTFVGLAK